MPALLIRQRVASYPAWKLAFEEGRAARWSNGCRGGRIFRNFDDPGEMVIFLEWDDPFRARLFSQSDEFLELLDVSEGANDPGVWILELKDEVGS